MSIFYLNGSNDLATVPISAIYIRLLVKQLFSFAKISLFFLVFLLSLTGEELPLEKQQIERPDSHAGVREIEDRAEEYHLLPATYDREIEHVHHLTMQECRIPGTERHKVSYAEWR